MERLPVGFTMSRAKDGLRQCRRVVEVMLETTQDIGHGDPTLTVEQ